MKKVLLVLVAMTAIWQSALAYSFSATAPTGQTLYYNIIDGGVEVTYPNTDLDYCWDDYCYWNGYSTPSGALIIPNEVEYNGTLYQVVAIGNYAFNSCADLTSVEIPSTVTSIGQWAFNSCTSLTSVTIPSSVTTIENRVFRNCRGLTSVTIPSSVTTIGEFAFESCTSLTSVEIPNSVTLISGALFTGCTNLTSVTLPNSVTMIGGSAFQGCSSLASLTIPNSVTTIGQYAFGGCTSLTSVTIPNSVTTIIASAFEGCTALTSVEIPNSITSISTSVFSGCTSLMSVTIPNSVTYIEETAFRGCTGLTAVTLPNSVIRIGDGAFSGCTGLTSMTIPGSMTTLGSSAFQGCTGLTSMTIPNSVTTMGDWIFYGSTGLTSVTIGNSVPKIGYAAFGGCTSLTSVEIPNSVTTIDRRAFEDCTGLTSLTIGNSVTTIDEQAFSGCTSLASVTIPNSVTQIGKSAFYGCTGLTSATIGNSVTTIGDYAFEGCTGIVALTIPNSVTSIGSNAFKGIRYIEYHGNATGSPWGAIFVNVFFDGGFVFEDSTKTTLLYYIGNSSSVAIPNTVIKIEKNAFKDNTGLTSVTIPNSVTSIGKDAFSGCTALASVNIPGSVTSIGHRAFAHCAIDSVVVPSSVVDFGGVDYGSCTVFDSCLNLVYARIGDPTDTTATLRTRVLPKQLFSNCHNLHSVEIGYPWTFIYGTFVNCQNLTDVNIGPSVDTIWTKSFYPGTRTSAPMKLHIPTSVKFIAPGAYDRTSVDTLLFDAISCGDDFGTRTATSWIPGQHNSQGGNNTMLGDSCYYFHAASIGSSMDYATLQSQEGFYTWPTGNLGSFDSPVTVSSNNANTLDKYWYVLVPANVTDVELYQHGGPTDWREYGENIVAINFGSYSSYYHVYRTRELHWGGSEGVNLVLTVNNEASTGTGSTGSNVALGDSCYYFYAASINSTMDYATLQSQEGLYAWPTSDLGSVYERVTLTSNGLNTIDKYWYVLVPMNVTDVQVYSNGMPTGLSENGETVVAIDFGGYSNYYHVYRSGEFGWGSSQGINLDLTIETVDSCWYFHSEDLGTVTTFSYAQLQAMGSYGEGADDLWFGWTGSLSTRTLNGGTNTLDKKLYVLVPNYKTATQYQSDDIVTWYNSQPYQTILFTNAVGEQRVYKLYRTDTTAYGGTTGYSVELEDDETVAGATDDCYYFFAPTPALSDSLDFATMLSMEGFYSWPTGDIGPMDLTSSRVNTIDKYWFVLVPTNVANVNLYEDEWLRKWAIHGENIVTVTYDDTSKYYYVYRGQFTHYGGTQNIRLEMTWQSSGSDESAMEAESDSCWYFYSTDLGNLTVLSYGYMGEISRHWDYPYHYNTWGEDNEDAWYGWRGSLYSRKLGGAALNGSGEYLYVLVPYRNNATIYLDGAPEDWHSCKTIDFVNPSGQLERYNIYRALRPDMGGTPNVSIILNDNMDQSVSLTNRGMGNTTTLRSLTIGNQVKRIPNYLAYGAHGLHTLTLPGSVESISTQAFAGCDSIGNIYLHRATPPQLDITAFDFDRLNAYGVVLHVPCDADSAYQNTYPWSLFGDRFVNDLGCAYALTVQAMNEGGTTSGSGEYIDGDTVTIAGVANRFYRFDHWSDGSHENPRTFIFDHTANAGPYGAYFTRDTLDVTLAVNDTTLGTLSLPSGRYVLGPLTVTATNIGYSRFVEWSDGSTNPTITAFLESDTTLTAYFTLDYWNLTATPANCSMGTVTGGGSYANGTMVTLTATPDAGWEFYAWTDGITTNPRTVQVMSDTVITAEFRPVGFVDKQTLYCTITDATNHTVSVGTKYHNPSFTVQAFITSVLIIPETVVHEGETYTVTGITAYGFGTNYSWEQNNTLTGVQLPNTITAIGEYAFLSCKALTSINLPDAITSIGSYAFQNCSGLDSLTVGSGLASIGSNAFSGVHVKYLNYNCSANLPASLTKDSLTTVIIGDSVTSIGNNAFSGCSGLTSINIPDAVTTIGNNAFSGCSRLTSINIPDAVTTIGNSAFSGCSGLTSINIPDAVTSIGEYAFRNCSALPSINLPDAVTSIGNYSFQNCTNLDSLTVGSGLATIGYSAFDGDTIKYLNYNCSANLPANVRTPSLTTVIIGDNVTSIGGSAFNGCTRLTSVTIGNSVTSIGNNAFQNCSGLTSINIPDAVTSIGENAFYGCSGLTTLTIGKSITSIGNYAFRECRGLTTVLFNADSCISVGNAVFYSDTNLTSIIFGNNVKRIPSYLCYNGCSRLTSVTLGDSIVSIGDWAFEFCSGLTSVTIGNSVTTIGLGAFNGCSGLTSVTIGNSVTTIGLGAFNGCSGLSSITIPDAVTSIGDVVFENCTGLDSLTVGSGLVSIGSDVFSNGPSIEYLNYNCSADVPSQVRNPSLTTVIIGDNVTSISEGAFYGCFSLNDIYSNPTVPPTASYDSFFGVGVPSACVLHIYCASDNAYRNATGWSGFTNIVHIDHCPVVLTASVNDTEKGTVQGGGNYAEEDTATLTAIANYGYHFTQWSDGDTLNPRTVVLTQDTAFVAYFDYNQYTVVGISADTVMGSVAGDTSADYLSSVTLTAVPNYGYHFTQWSDGNIDNPRTFVLTQDTTFTAQFGYNQYTVTGNSADTVMGSVAGSATQNYLTTVTLTATANYGYHFTQWSDGNTDNPRTVTVTSDTVYTAQFGYNQYTVTGNSADTVMGSVAGSATQNYLSSVTLTATANYGYHFTQWSDGNTDNPRTLVLTQDTAFTAQFGYNQYTVTGVSADTVMGSVAGSATQNYLTTVTLTATANYGYHFTQWSDGVTDNPRTVTVDSNKTYTAQFDYNQYSIALAVDTTIHGTVSGAGSYDYLSERTISATANYGYHFTQWSDGVTDNPRTVVLTQDTVFTAQFGYNQYTVSGVSADTAMGTVAGGATQDYLTTVTLTATANYGYHFAQWSDGVTDNPRTVTVDSNKTYTAQFGYNQYTVTGSSADTVMGTVAGGTSANYLSSVTLTAVPNYGYHFAQWSDGDTNNPRTVVLTQDTAFTAQFGYNQYTVSGVSADTAMGTVAGGTTQDYLTTVTLTATANYGYHFAQWNDGNTDNPRTVTVDSNKTYTAQFGYNQYTVSGVSADTVMGTVTGGTSANYLSSVTLTAVPNYGYHFTQWSDGVTDNPRTVTVTSDTIYMAQFAINQYTVNVVSIDETMGTVSGGGEYVHGDTATLTATPSEGHHFVAWSNGMTETTISLVVVSDTTLSATFAEDINIYMVTVDYDETMGEVTGAGEYDEGATATLTATAYEGFRFVGWSTGETEATITFTVTEDVNLTAHFEAVTGIENIEAAQITVYSTGDKIVVKGAKGMSVVIYDGNGRAIAHETNVNEYAEYVMSASGVYMIKVGTLPAKKVVVVR